MPVHPYLLKHPAVAVGACVAVAGAAAYSNYSLVKSLGGSPNHGKHRLVISKKHSPLKGLDDKNVELVQALSELPIGTIRYTAPTEMAPGEKSYVTVEVFRRGYSPTPNKDADPGLLSAGNSPDPSLFEECQKQDLICKKHNIKIGNRMSMRLDCDDADFDIRAVNGTKNQGEPEIIDRSGSWQFNITAKQSGDHKQLTLVPMVYLRIGDLPETPTSWIEEEHIHIKVSVNYWHNFCEFFSNYWTQLSATLAGLGAILSFLILNRENVSALLKRSSSKTQTDEKPMD